MTDPLSEFGLDVHDPYTTHATDHQRAICAGYTDNTPASVVRPQQCRANSPVVSWNASHVHRRLLRFPPHSPTERQHHCPTPRLALTTHHHPVLHHPHHTHTPLMPSQRHCYEHPTQPSHIHIPFGYKGMTLVGAHPYTGGLACTRVLSGC